MHLLGQCSQARNGTNGNIFSLGGPSDINVTYPSERMFTSNDSESYVSNVIQEEYKSYIFRAQAPVCGQTG